MSDMIVTPEEILRIFPEPMVGFPLSADYEWKIVEQKPTSDNSHTAYSLFLRQKGQKKWDAFGVKTDADMNMEIYNEVIQAKKTGKIFQDYFFTAEEMKKIAPYYLENCSALATKWKWRILKSFTFVSDVDRKPRTVYYLFRYPKSSNKLESLDVLFNHEIDMKAYNETIQAKQK
ncbi:MAG: hypothetical protein QXW57_04335 [Candidatus Micrarchaeaceae archaeon]